MLNILPGAFLAVSVKGVLNVSLATYPPPATLFDHFQAAYLRHTQEHGRGVQINENVAQKSTSAGGGGVGGAGGGVQIKENVVQKSSSAGGGGVGDAGGGVQIKENVAQKSRSAGGGDVGGAGGGGVGEGVGGSGGGGTRRLLDDLAAEEKRWRAETANAAAAAACFDTSRALRGLDPEFLRAIHFESESLRLAIEHGQQLLTLPAAIMLRRLKLAKECLLRMNTIATADSKRERRRDEWVGTIWKAISSQQPSGLLLTENDVGKAIDLLLEIDVDHSTLSSRTSTNKRTVIKLERPSDQEAALLQTRIQHKIDTAKAHHLPVNNDMTDVDQNGQHDEESKSAAGAQDMGMEVDVDHQKGQHGEVDEEHGEEVDDESKSAAGAEGAEMGVEGASMGVEAEAERARVRARMRASAAATETPEKRKNPTNTSSPATTPQPPAIPKPIITPAGKRLIWHRRI